MFSTFYLNGMAFACSRMLIREHVESQMKTIIKRLGVIVPSVPLFAAWRKLKKASKMNDRLGKQRNFPQNQQPDCQDIKHLGLWEAFGGLVLLGLIINGFVALTHYKPTDDYGRITAVTSKVGLK
jgi:hypothetical protein